MSGEERTKRLTFVRPSFTTKSGKRTASRRAGPSDKSTLASLSRLAKAVGSAPHPLDSLRTSNKYAIHSSYANLSRLRARDRDERGIDDLLTNSRMILREEEPEIDSLRVKSIVMGLKTPDSSRPNSSNTSATTTTSTAAQPPAIRQRSSSTTTLTMAPPPSSSMTHRASLTPTTATTRMPSASRTRPKTSSGPPSSSSSSSTSLSNPTKPHTNAMIMHILDHTPHAPDNLEARIACARSLFKLSCQAGSERSIIDGGAIVQVTDFSDVENLKLQEFCAAILANLTTNLTALEAFVTSDGVAALLELSWSEAIDVKLLCATALCRLSQHATFVTKLVRSRAIIEFLAMMVLPSDLLRVLCISCTSNIIHYGHVFPERVFLGDPHALQNHLGIMNIIQELAAKPKHSQFIADVLFNVSLHRASSFGALKGGVAEILLTISTHATKHIDQLAKTPANSNSKEMTNNLRVLHLAAQTLKNLSSYTDYHSLLCASGSKLLGLLLLHPLRELGTRTLYLAALAKERVALVAGACAQVFANFSAPEDTRRHVFQNEMVFICMKLFLIDTALVVPLPPDASDFFANAIRTISNLSFNSQCTAQMMRGPELLPLLNNTVVAATTKNNNSNEQVKEDALVAILNIARQPRYHTAVLESIDGEALAHAAELESNRRVKYVYAILIMNLVFEPVYKPLVYCEWVVAILETGFKYSSTAQHTLRDTNLTSPEDTERFLAALCPISSELRRPEHLERLVRLIVNCLNSVDTVSKNSSSTTTVAHRKSLEGFAAAALHALARAAATLDHNERRTSTIYSEATEAALARMSRKRGVSSSSHAKAFCAATLYHICASGHVNLRIVEALVNSCETNDQEQSLLACSASFAIISFQEEGRQLLLKCQNLAKALNKLGRTSLVECQQYAAITSCNVSTLKCIWLDSDLSDFIVVALLRANSSQARQSYAKTLYNLISHTKSREQLVDDGCLYALMKLCQIPPKSNADDIEESLNLGIQALFSLSCEEKYHHRLLTNCVISHLLTAVNGRTKSRDVLVAEFDASGNDSFVFHSPITVEGRRNAIGIVCNLSAYEENHKELMEANVAEVIRKYTGSDTETRASAAMALRNLSCKQPWVEMLCERKTLSLLMTFTTSSNNVVRRFSIETLANCSLVNDSVHLFGDLKVVRGVLSLLETTPLEKESYTAALKLIHNLAFDDGFALNLMEEDAIVRLLPLLEHSALGDDVGACLIAARMISILASKAECAPYMIQQKIVSFCALLQRKHPEDVALAYECAVILMTMSTYQQIHTNMTETSVIQVLVDLCARADTNTQEILKQRQCIHECSVVTIRNLTLSVTEHLTIFYEDEKPAVAVGRKLTHRDSSNNAMSQSTTKNLLDGVQFLQEQVTWAAKDPASNPVILREAAVALANLSTVKLLRVEMVRLGVVSTLLKLYSSEIAAIKTICAATLHRLALEEEAQVETGLIPSLLSILNQSDDKIHHIRYECEKLSSVQNRVEPLLPLVAATICCKQNYRAAKWILFAVEATISLRNMTPEMEKKTMRSIGLPQISSGHLAAQKAAAKENDHPTAGSSGNKFVGSLEDCDHEGANALAEAHGYLQEVDMEKRMVQRNGTTKGNANGNTETGEGDKDADPETNTLSRKYERHMRVTRRNYRKNPTLLPLLTIV